MTLATIRSHLWRGGSDVVLTYRGNGKKKILHAPPPQSPPQQAAANVPTATANGTGAGVDGTPASAEAHVGAMV